LILLPSSLVHKINFDSKKVKGDVKATSVEFETGGKTYTVKFSKDVVVSGGVHLLLRLSLRFQILTMTLGTVNTPQILELSGIGSPKILKAAGIKTVVDLPGVGENLQVCSLPHVLAFARLTLRIPRLQDHLAIYAIVELTKNHTSLDSLADPAVLQQQLDL
jgi:hypothetical protein